MSSAPRVHGALAGGSPRNGLPEGTGYTYRGTKFDATPTPGQAERQERARRAARREPITPAPCGTYPGYQTHRRNKEQPCEPCKQARRDYARANKAAHRLNPEGNPQWQPQTR